MSKTVLGVFEDTMQAEKAVDELQKRGVKKEDISIVAREGMVKEGGRGGRGQEGDTTMGFGQDISGGVSTCLLYTSRSVRSQCHPRHTVFL